ncbi:MULTISPECIES: LPXTG cell wall anchor domain-containing protein [Cytobacillus]
MEDLTGRQNGSQWFIWVAAVLAISVILIFLLMRRKKNNK